MINGEIMYKKLENYLEHVSHFLSGAKEREEILSEIRSHILEKASEDSPATEEALEKVIAAYGKPRHVAEKYLDGQPVIAPVFKRYLFRYTSILFAIHLVFIIFAAIFGRSFIVFPFLFVPRLGFIEAVLYTPAAFLSDFGIVALVLYFITRSGKEIHLPWPKFAVDLDETKGSAGMTLATRTANLVGAVILAVLTGLGVHLFLRYNNIIFITSDFRKFQPLLLQHPGQFISLAILALMAAGCIVMFLKASNVSRRLACWVVAVADALALVLIGLAFRLPFSFLSAVGLTQRSRAWMQASLTVTLLVFALLVAVDLVTNLVRLGRKRMAK
jgi:hypothetical protein